MCQAVLLDFYSFGRKGWRSVKKSGFLSKSRKNRVWPLCRLRRFEPFLSLSVDWQVFIFILGNMTQFKGFLIFLCLTFNSVHECVRSTNMPGWLNCLSTHEVIKRSTLKRKAKIKPVRQYTDILLWKCISVFGTQKKIYYIINWPILKAEFILPCNCKRGRYHPPHTPLVRVLLTV